jgi:hypothetical protein
MDYQLFCILSHLGFPEHTSLSVSSVYRTCEDFEDIFCVYAENRTAAHICLYNDLALILDADELQLLLTVYDWFMDNTSNPKFYWTIHPASKIPPTITGTINTTTTATTAIIAKSDIPAEYHTTTLETLPTRCHIINKMHYIITNHQIIPLQRSLLVPKYTISIFLATTYELFGPGGISSFDLQFDVIMFSQTQSPCFSLPPDLRSEAWGVSVFPVFPRIPCVSLISVPPIAHHNHYMSYFFLLVIEY